MERVTMNIDGMTCGHCVASVKKALTSLDGVEVEQVELGQAVVNYDPAATSPAALANAIEDEGYAVISTESGGTR